MPHERLALDTPPDIEQRQVERWREMTDEEKGALITGLTRAAFDMTAAGVRARHPEAGPREHLLRMAIAVLGDDLARRAYPEIDTLDNA